MEGLNFKVKEMKVLDEFEKWIFLMTIQNYFNFTNIHTPGWVQTFQQLVWSFMIKSLQWLQDTTLADPLCAHQLVKCFVLDQAVKNEAVKFNNKNNKNSFGNPFNYVVIHKQRQRIHCPTDYFQFLASLQNVISNRTQL